MRNDILAGWPEPRRAGVLGVSSWAIGFPSVCAGEEDRLSLNTFAAVAQGPRELVPGPFALRLM